MTKKSSDDLLNPVPTGGNNIHPTAKITFTEALPIVNTGGNNIKPRTRTTTENLLTPIASGGNNVIPKITKQTSDVDFLKPVSSGSSQAKSSTSLRTPRSSLTVPSNSSPVLQPAADAALGEVTTQDTDQIIKSGDNTFIVKTNKDVYVNTYEQVTEQKYITTGGGGGVTSIVAGSNVNISSTGPGGTGDVTINSTGGSGNPGGSDTQVQFNDSNSFGGNSGFTYNKNTNTVGLTNIANDTDINIEITGTGIWIFGTDGSLSLPLSGTISEGVSPTSVGNTITLAPNGGSPTQALLIYPTEGEGDHLHLTAGGGTTELYLGNDDQYVKLVNGGNVEIRANDLMTFSSPWTFGYDGSLTGSAIYIKNTYEAIVSLSDATGVVEHNFSQGSIFNHTNILSDFTADFTYLNLLVADLATNAVLILNQGATAYLPTAVQIGGVAQTINWQGGSPPTGNANQKDIVSFSIVNISSTYTVFGQLVTFA